MSSNAENRRRAVMAARGEIPFDLLLTGAQIVDMVTGEIREADVGITGEMIASVHPRGSRADAHQRHALDGAYLSPGLMDTHVHLESSHLPPERYAEIVLAQGTTAVFWDPHELANVLGVEGVRYAVAASRHLPLQVMVAAPSSVPSTPGLEMSGADFAGAEMETMLGWPEVRGVAEVMDMHGVLNGSPRMQEIVQAGLDSGKLIEGHARGLSGADLQAYLAAGVTSDHELTSAEDALEKLRAGLTLEIRGSHPYLLPDIVKALKTLPHLSSQITVCTDDVPPDMLLEKGGIMNMMNSVAMTIIAMMFGGIMEGTHQLEVVVNKLKKLAKGPAGLVTLTEITCVISNMTMPEQYISIVVPGRMYAEEYRKMGLHPAVLSSALEGAGTVTSALVPWNTCGVFISDTLGIGVAQYGIYAIFNWLMPVINALCAYVGITLKDLDNKPYKKQAAAK